MPLATVIVIHGYQGVPDDVWKPWLQEELLRRDVAVSTPAMPTPAHPRELAWLNLLESLVARAETPTILVGHSLGGLAVLRYLEIRAATPIQGAVSVAGVTDPGLMDPKRYSFATEWGVPTDWKRIRSMARQIVALYSYDDQVVPLHHGELLAEKSGATLLKLDGYQHFSRQTSNPRQLPELLQVIDNLIQLAK